MICPNCDGMLNGIGCQSCGWKHGDPWPSHRLVTGTAHPLRADGQYPARASDPLPPPTEEVSQQSVEYADGSSATSNSTDPLPLVSPEGAPAILVNGVPVTDVAGQPFDQTILIEPDEDIKSSSVATNSEQPASAGEPSPAGVESAPAAATPAVVMEHIPGPAGLPEGVATVAEPEPAANAADLIPITSTVQ